MRGRLLSALVISVVAARAQVPGAERLAGFVSAWSQRCPDSCSPPQAAGGSEEASAALALPSAPGQAAAARVEEDFAYPGGERLHARIDFYFVCPKSAPAGADCPARYVQAQVLLTGDARAFCAASLNPKDAFPFPVLMCAGDDLKRPGARLGVSLSRRPLPDAAAARP